MRRRFFNNNIEYFDINDYLTIEALEDNLQVRFPQEDLMYGIDGMGWQKLIAGKNSPSINAGQTISFKGNLTPTIGGIGTFTITKRCNLLGNCMSLLFGDDTMNNNSLSGKNYAFQHLFAYCTTIIQVSESFLPATTLAEYCYYNMFENCTSLTTAPELPATTLASNCYRHMFWNCTSLTIAPKLPATTLASSCYENMFNGCTSLTTAPELPATTLAGSCYEDMFLGCTSLTTAPELPATKLASYCYGYMFRNCTSLTTAPELPATTLVDSCYRYMFYGCSKLNYIKMLATDISATNCLSAWVSGVASIGTFVKNKNATWNVTGVSGVPNGWTIQKV